MRRWLLLVVLLGVPVAFGSEPDFAMTNLLGTEATNGESDFGDLLFIERTYIPQRFYMTSITDSDSFQKYDILTWGGESVKMINPVLGEQILINGSEYFFDRSGTYTMQSLSNSSISAFLQVAIEDENRINITNIDTPVGFNLTFDTTSFVLDGEKTVKARMQVDDDISKGDYTVSFDINEVNHGRNFKVLQNINWTMNTANFSQTPTIKAGEGMYLGRIVLQNVGNEDVEVSVAKSGNETGIIGLPTPSTLYRKNQLHLDFQAQVPTIVKAGKYEMLLTIKGGDITKTVSLNITVVDSIKPIIESIEFSSDNVFVDNTVTVYATDNDDVINVTMEFSGEVYPFEKDGNRFTNEGAFTKLSRYVMLFCAEDQAGNRECQTLNKTFSKIKVIEGNEKVLEMDSMRFGKYSRIKLFNLTEKVEEPLILEVISYDAFPDTNVTPVFRVVDGDGSIKTFGQYNNEVQIQDASEYFLEIRADEEVDLEGVIRLNLPEQYETIEDMTFTVGFKSYDIPKPFEKQWVDDRDMVCEVVDTGNLDTSYYDCNMRYPIDTRPEDISVPTTVKERTTFEEEADKVRDLLTTSKTRSGWIIGLMVGILLISILWTVYLVKWYPYIRMQTGKTTSDEKLR